MKNTEIAPHVDDRRRFELTL